MFGFVLWWFWLFKTLFKNAYTTGVKPNYKISLLKSAIIFFRYLYFLQSLWKFPKTISYLKKFGLSLMSSFIYAKTTSLQNWSHLIASHCMKQRISTNVYCVHYLCFATWAIHHSKQTWHQWQTLEINRRIQLLCNTQYTHTARPGKHGRVNLVQWRTLDMSLFTWYQKHTALYNWSHFMYTKCI